MKKEKVVYNLIKEEAIRLFNNKHYKFVDGDELCLFDRDLFEGEEEMNFKFANGIAVSEGCTYALVYPRKETLNTEMRDEIQMYDGIPAPRAYTYRDIALTYGVVIKL